MAKHCILINHVSWHFGNRTNRTESQNLNLPYLKGTTNYVMVTFTVCSAHKYMCSQYTSDLAVFQMFVFRMFTAEKKEDKVSRECLRKSQKKRAILNIKILVLKHFKHQFKDIYPLGKRLFCCCIWTLVCQPLVQSSWIFTMGF